MHRLKKKGNHINLSHIQIHAYSLSGLLLFQDQFMLETYSYLDKPLLLYYLFSKSDFSCD